MLISVNRKRAGGVIAAVALEIVLQAQSESHVIGAPGLAARPHFYSGLLIGSVALLDQIVVQGLEITEAVQLGDAGRDLIEIQRFPHQRLHLRQDRPFVAL